MCGTFAVSPDTGDKATAFFVGRRTATSLAVKFADDGDASYLYMSREQAEAVRDRLNQLLPVHTRPPVILVGSPQYPLDQAWRIVDSQGGRFNASDPDESKRDKRIGLACRLIEALGGMDPALRPLPASQVGGMAA